MQKISIVIPCYCSEMFLEHTVNNLFNAIKTISNYDYEVILVDDCSKDQTYKVIQNLSKKYNQIKGLKLSINAGQHNALMAGMNYVTGDYIICMDDDGQTDPLQMFKLVDKLNEGYDVVYARYTHKKHNFLRNIGSQLNEYMAAYLINKPKELYVSSYFIMKRFVLEEILKYHYPYTYIIGLILRTTQNITNVDIVHKERKVGKSGYNFKKLLGLWLNGFTAFSVKPLRIATIFGVLCSLFGVLGIVYLIINKLVNPQVPLGWTSIATIVLLIGGIIMVMLGLIGEYIGRIYVCINKSPQYVIGDKTENFYEKC